ncbi:uncharacterized protein LOC142544389 [Primulina tabacum]|uniref:uncharacterized protein LOC142544389 n=1 Tax=Primulina tabacum TaxID=48773 RepID=UPI003F5A8553
MPRIKKRLSGQCSCKKTQREVSRIETFPNELVSEVLARVAASSVIDIINAKLRGWIRGVRVASSSPSVSHLFFADDSLVFFRASLEEGARVKECLHAYERASGQLINCDKSALSFSPNTNSSLIESIKMVLTIPVVQRHDIYLGLPTVSLRSKRLQFRYLVDRVVKRTQGWGHKCFSVGGKELLIKSVLQSIPTYAMSCFRIPKSICDEIEKECANFWWGVENGKRKLHWKTWDFLCKPKMRGGLGFRKMDEFNRALLANQFWRLLRNPESLATKVLKGRYFRHGDINTSPFFQRSPEEHQTIVRKEKMRNRWTR